MPALPAPARPASPLRRDVRLASWNAALWAIGAGMAPTLLVTYLAMDLGAQGIEVSAVLAAPRLAGLLRLFVPALIRRLGSRKLLCLVGYGASGLMLLLLPALADPSRYASPRSGLAVLVACWALYQVCEYFGTTALWSWLGDLFPPRVRGRLVGQRERWLVSGQIAGMLLGFVVTTCWQAWFPATPRWTPLAASAACGAVMMLLAVLPLVLMRKPLARKDAFAQSSWAPMQRALSDWRFRRLLLWSMALAVANGIAAAARGVMPYRVLGLTYPALLPMMIAMRAGQAFVAPIAGRWVDRVGCRRVLFASQAIVATSPLFFLAASSPAPWWVAGAYLAWIAYGGLNVGLDSLKLELSPPGNNAPALSLFYAVSDLSSGLTLLAGGLLLDGVFSAGAQLASSYQGPLLLETGLRTLVLFAVLLLPAGRAGRRVPSRPTQTRDRC